MSHEFSTKVSALRDELEVLNEALREASRQLDRSQKEFNERQAEKFKAADGCTKCNGRGWRVVWDTMDSMSGCYAEYGPCTNESCNASVTGPNMDFRVYSKYDGLRGTQHPSRTSDYNFLCGQLHDVIRSLNAKRDSLTHEITMLGWFNRGDNVVVVKGRKVPVGSSGRVFWTDTNPRSGMQPSRIGVDTGTPDPKQPGKNVVFFVSAANCEKV